MTEAPTEPAEDLAEQIRAFNTLATQFAESATEVMGVAIRMQMLMLEQAQEGLADVADELDEVIARTRTAEKPED